MNLRGDVLNQKDSPSENHFLYLFPDSNSIRIGAINPKEKPPQDRDVRRQTVHAACDQIGK
jgi:hypothetical protein